MQHSLNSLYTWLDTHIAVWPSWAVYVVNIAATTILIAVAASVVSFILMAALPSPTFYLDAARRRRNKKIRLLGHRYPRATWLFGALAEEVTERERLQAAQRAAAEEKRRRDTRYRRQRIILESQERSGNKSPLVADSSSKSRDLPVESVNVVPDSDRSSDVDIGSVEVDTVSPPNRPPDQDDGIPESTEQSNTPKGRDQQLDRLLDLIYSSVGPRVTRWHVWCSRSGFKVRRFVQIVFLPLGAYLLGSGRNPLTWMRSIFRFWAVALACVIVLWVRPIKAIQPALEPAWHRLWSWLTGTTPTRLLPVVLLVVGLLIFARRGPLIDHIRARDEAAKDTNKLLAQLLGRLIPLYVELSQWCNILETNYWSELILFVHDASAGKLVMTAHPKILPVASARPHLSFKQYESPANAELERLVTQVIQLQQNFLESGLSTVAARLTRSRYLHIREVGLLPTWSKPQDEQLRIRMCVPSHLAQRRADYLSRLGATKVDYSSQYDLDLLWRITSEFAVERNLYIIRSQVSLSSLLTTIHYLEGRVAGRWWLRMLSIVAK